MNELITITTGGQGSPVVSARELHLFLEVKSKFADWIKNRIIRYGFLEETDYVIVESEAAGFSKNLEKVGRPELDYALTLDMAKQLAMVERTQKGKEARLYFIEAEKTLQQVMATPPPISTTEQVLLQLVSQTNQLMANQSELLAQLRADVDQIIATGHKPPKANRPGKQLGIPGTNPPFHARRIGSGVGSSSLRQLIHARVVDYCEYYNETTQDAYRYLYKKMLIAFGIDVYRLGRMEGENLLDVVERYGLLDRLYSVVMAELTYKEE